MGRLDEVLEVRLQRQHWQLCRARGPVPASVQLRRRGGRQLPVPGGSALRQRAFQRCWRRRGAQGPGEPDLSDVHLRLELHLASQGHASPRVGRHPR